ncbi:hypothetical protein Tco_1396897 [Tanacetum coccineum]
MSLSYEREAVYARHAWSCLEDRSTALEALIRAQEARITVLEARITTLQIQHGKMKWQRQEAGDMVTRAFGLIHALEARDPACPYDLEDTGGVEILYFPFCNQNYHKMAPKKTTILMSNAAIKTLVARSVADALAKHEANRNNRNRDDSHESGSG